MSESQPDILENEQHTVFDALSTLNPEMVDSHSSVQFRGLATAD